MMIDLEPEEIEYLSVIVAQDILSDRLRDLERTADRHIPLLGKLQRAVDGS